MLASLLSDENSVEACSFKYFFIAIRPVVRHDEIYLALQVMKIPPQSAEPDSVKFEQFLIAVLKFYRCGQVIVKFESL